MLFSHFHNLLCEMLRIFNDTNINVSDKQNDTAKRLKPCPTEDQHTFSHLDPCLWIVALLLALLSA